MNSALISVSAADATTLRNIFDMLSTAPLLSGYLKLSDMKNVLLICSLILVMRGMRRCCKGLVPCRSHCRLRQHMGGMQHSLGSTVSFPGLLMLVLPGQMRLHSRQPALWGPLCGHSTGRYRSLAVQTLSYVCRALVWCPPLLHVGFFCRRLELHACEVDC